MIDRAIELHGDEAVSAHVSSKSNGKCNLIDIQFEGLMEGYPPDTRALLGKSARTDGKKARKGGWFKSLGYMEDLTCDIIVPCAESWDRDFKRRVTDLLKWIVRARRD